MNWKNTRRNGYRYLFLVSLLAFLFVVGCEDEETIEATTITVSPSSATIEIDSTQQFTAKVEDQNGDEMDVTVTWTSSDDNIATIDANGLATGTGKGTVTITASAEGVSGTASLTVALPELAYKGSESCNECHSAIYSDFIDSGHPYKFNLIDKDNPVAPTYPSFVKNYMALPDGATSWDDIAGVIGGFGWKARFVDKTGHVVGTAESVINTGGGQNQHNFFDGIDWGKADYHPNDVKIYNQGCFRCHTTGAVATDNPDSSWLKVNFGISVTDTVDYFEFGGIQCEACHGMGSQHIATEDPQYIKEINHESGDVNELCGSCHYRDSEHRVLASGGFIKHHEQYDEFLYTEHYKDNSMDCSSCHDPHKRTIWDGDAIKVTCESCHTDKTANHNALADCVTCHMPFAAKSAVKQNAYKGDIHSHTFSISADTTWDMIVTDTDGKDILQTDSLGYNHLSLQSACYQCHKDVDGEGGEYSAKTLNELATKAATIH